MTTATNTLDGFRQAIADAGLTPPYEILPDAQFHRFASDGDPGDDAGWYKLYSDGLPAGSFGCFRLGITRTWCAKSDTAMTGTERAEYRRRIDKIQREREAEEQRRHAEAAKRARTIWDHATPAPADHPYLLNKVVQSHGLCVDTDNRLIMPVMINHAITSLQFISPDGSKQFLPGGKVKCGSFLLGDPTGARLIVLVCEGFATGASLHQATAYPVVIAFHAGNLLPVAHELRQRFPEAVILLCGDNDLHEDGTPNTGVNAATAAANAINGIPVIPELNGQPCDWNDVARTTGLEAVREQIEAALTPSPAPSSTTPPEAEPQVDIPIGMFAPIPAPQLLDESEPVQAEWVWEEFIPQGGLAALVAKPKVGKTTNAYELAVKVAQGLPYLGRATRQGRVLILALEEHRREVKRRLRNLGADQINDIHLHVGPLADSPDTVHHLKQYIEQHGIILVILDTLNSFWSVQEENDAVAVTKAIKPLLALARESAAAILLLHHARKSEGEFGDEIRGSGALFSLLDVALILKRHEVENQRKLTAVSRYPETPPELIIELREHGHEALGDPASVGKAAKNAKVRSALTDSPTPAPKIGQCAGVSRGAAYSILDGLVKHGQAKRTGTGKRNDPYLYFNFVSVSPLMGRGVNETNCSPGPIGDEASPPQGFVSFGGPILDPQENETNQGNEDSVSFMGDGGQTKRNESEGDEKADEPEDLVFEEDPTC